MKNKKKYLSFDDLRISYDPRDNVVRLSSGDEVLKKEKFHLTLMRNTPLDDSLRKLLSKEGIIKPRPSLDLPDFASIQDAQETPWDVIPLGQAYNRRQVNWETSVEPHALLAGSTGSGKSIIQASVLRHLAKNIQHWDIYGIDLKRVELKYYADNYLLQENFDIATDVASSLQMLQKLESILSARYEILNEKGMNNIAPFIESGNKKAIFLLIDEAFPLLAPNPALKEKANNEMRAEMAKIIADLARLGRAAGIHLMISTQRPDATVITGELKNNLDVRIAAGRLSATPSAMILDSGAASHLSDVRGRAVIRSRSELEDFQAFYTSRDDFPA